MNDLEMFYVDFHQQIQIEATDTWLESQFLQKATEYLIDEGIVEDFVYLPYRSPRGLRADGYDLDDERGILHLFIADFRNTPKPESLTRTDIQTILKRAENFFKAALDPEFHRKLEESSPGYELAWNIWYNRERFFRVRIHLLSDAVLSSRVEGLETGNIEGYTVSYDIWDISRFYKIEASGKTKEDIEIDFAKEFKAALPALPAHIASSDYRSYLVVIPGGILADLYEKYGARLLEQNVRTFLQERGKVNQGIRDTIRNNPEMFFAYNNGLTTTAEAVELTEDGRHIVRLQNLQIVNGGQTTASLYNARKKFRTDLSRVFVQMKLTVIDDPEKVDEIVPKISRYANTQNKVSEADFFSNHPYHIRIEEKSRRIWAPAKEGEIHQTKWFYERARGQYMDAQAHMTPAQKKAFRKEYPPSQKFTKTDLAKFVMVWEEQPHTVSLGAQKNFRAFAGIIDRQWKHNDKIFNDRYYHKIIAKAIMFRTLEKLVSAQPWYSGGYRANIVAYSISTFAWLVRASGKFVNFDEIWKQQQLPAVLYREFEKISEFVSGHITDTPENISNVTEWAKKKYCWEKQVEKLEQGELELSDEVRVLLMDAEEEKIEEKEARKEQKIDNEVDIMKKVVSLGAAGWQEILSRGMEENLLTEADIALIRKAMHIEKTGRLPTGKQMKRLLEVYTKIS